MTTVKEFKYLDGKFVIGDTCQVVGAIEPFKVNHTWLGNAKNSEFCDRQEVISFAWRPINTLPDNPKFKYEIGGHMPQWRPLLEQPKQSAYDVDAHVSCGRAKGGVIPNNILGQMHEVDKRETVFNKIPGSDNDVYAIDSSDCDCEITVRYKPTLSIFTTDRFPKIKPVFTKEFAIRGGSSTPFVWESCIVKYIGRKYVVLIDSNGREHSRKKSKLMIRDIDTRTPKQKAVDDIEHIVKYMLRTNETASDIAIAIVDSKILE